MSQIPPSPFGNQPPPPPFPPGQYGQPPMPPYGQQSGYPGQPYGMPQKTSGAAIASLVLGFVGFCVPLIGGLVAIILGIVGIGTTGKPNVKGRGLAIAGLILGVLSMLGWAGAGLGIFGLYQASAPDRATARQFMVDLSTGNETAATAECVPGTAPELIQADIAKLQPLGTLTDTTFFGMSINNNNGASTTVVAGSAQFGTAVKTVSFTLVPSAGGKHLIQKWEIK